MASSTSTANIGRSLLRREDPALLKGEARFIADLAVDDAAHAVFVRAPFAHAEVGTIDAAEAAAMPGVRAIITAADVADLEVSKFHPKFPDGVAQPLLATDRVRYVGEPVAVVVADSYSRAVDAAELVDVDYEPLPVVVDLDRATSDEVVIFDDVGTNIVLSADRSDSNIGQHEIEIERRVVSPRQSAAPIETRGVVARWVDDELLVWSSTQKPHGLRDRYMTVYGLDADAVRVVAGPHVGGGFGGKGAISVEEVVLPRVAAIVGDAVRWIETRSEYLTAAPQSRGEIVDVTLAGRSDGTFESIKVHLLKDAGAYPMVGALLALGYSKPIATGCYRIPEVDFAFTSVVTNAPSTSAFRGAGRAPIVHAIECAVDAFAAEVGMDPAALRRHNLIRPDEMPWESPTGALYDEADYPADFERALALVDYESLRREQARRRPDPEAKLLGIGVVAYNHITNGAGGEEASITIRPDGSAVVVTGSSDQGHGHAMSWAQIEADVLAIPVEQIDVVEGDTDRIKTGIGAVGSRSLQTAGIAVHQSAEAVVERARRAAAEHFEAALGDVVLDQLSGRFHVVGTPALALGWAEVVAVANGFGDPERELACGADFAGPNTYPSGSHVAVVEVDPVTGLVDVIRYAGVDDAGRRVNPMIVDGQLHGGIAAGLSQALGEVVAFDGEGNPITSNFMDYSIATVDLVPSIQLEAAAISSSFNSLGFKGVGESGTIGAAPAVHLAVLDAIRHLGVEHLDMPCSPLRVWEAMNLASGG